MNDDIIIYIRNIIFLKNNYIMVNKKVAKKSSKKVKLVSKKVSKKVSKSQKGGNKSYTFLVYDYLVEKTRGVEPLYTVTIDNSATIQQLYELICDKYKVKHIDVKKCLGVWDSFALYLREKESKKIIIRNSTIIETIFISNTGIDNSNKFLIFIK